ncbi:MAG: hypothetical protein GY724_06265 [Actinomycetia bacterium]|nr:hypothetical protein [Actinomycetes bacterium]
MTVLAWLLAGVVGIAFVAIGHLDWRTSRVVVSHAVGVTIIAVGGFGALAIASSNWANLASSAAGAILVTTIQLVPYTLQRGRGGALIGTADVRLGVPFGWTLGYFGLSFAFIGFAIALVSGLTFALVSGRQQVPFVPFLSIGLLAGLGWAMVVALS